MSFYPNAIFNLFILSDVLWSVRLFPLQTFPWSTRTFIFHVDKSLFRRAWRWSSWDFLLGSRRPFLELVGVFRELLSYFAKVKNAWQVMFLNTYMSATVFIANICLKIWLDIKF